MIIHIFASRPLNKDKNYIFIVFLSSLSPILLDSIKKQAKNASKRLKIGKSAELFPHFSQRCEFPPPRYRKRELCTPVASCDSSKPAVISMDDYVLVENAMSIFEKTSGYSG